jgi:23S rRNA (adenine2503-C2)-methyltransferase
MDRAAVFNPSADAPIHGLPLHDLTALFKQQGLSAFQARLAFKAMQRYGITDFNGMPEISAAARKFLQSLPPLPEVKLDTLHRAHDGTLKLRVQIPTGEFIESVIIPAAGRVTLCVSSQVGCAAGCGFCHTATMGLLRNLAAWEIVGQYRLAQRVFSAEGGGKISNIVFMGMGEPLHNEASVVQACRILNDDNGPGFSRRHLVMSTAGVGNRIRPFWEENVASLAISLHATTDEIRDRIVPLNRQWNLQALREILLAIPWANRESLTVAYLLLDGVNDTREDAQRLAEWSRGLPAKINLLEFNPFPGTEFKRAGPEKLAAFRQWLHDFGVFNTLRRSRGDDVMAACGQLATPSKRRAKSRTVG